MTKDKCEGLMNEDNERERGRGREGERDREREGERASETRVKNDGERE